MQIRMLGLADYQTVYDDMTAFTEGRNDNTADELFCHGMLRK